MVTEGIKTPVQEPTEWLSRMIVVGKPDCDVRICLDPSELNKAIQRLHFLVPTIRRLFRKLSKVHYFLSLDAASGFHQIPLTNEASYFCTMATPKVRYMYSILQKNPNGDFFVLSHLSIYRETVFGFFT